MTEDEAKKKLCPLFYIAVVQTSGAFKSSSKELIDEAIHCQGSACMLWRNVVTENGTTLMQGYCGLAGKP